MYCCVSVVYICTYLREVFYFKGRREKAEGFDLSSVHSVFVACFMSI